VKSHKRGERAAAKIIWRSRKTCTCGSTITGAATTKTSLNKQANKNLKQVQKGKEGVSKRTKEREAGKEKEKGG
jgi:hypothetical protein